MLVQVNVTSMFCQYQNYVNVTSISRDHLISLFGGFEFGRSLECDGPALNEGQNFVLDDDRRFVLRIHHVDEVLEGVHGIWVMFV